MGKAYSLDLRERVISLRDKGETQARIRELLDIHISTVKRYLVRQKERGSVAATVQQHGQSQLQSTELAVIKALLKAKNDVTISLLVVQFAERTGIRSTEIISGFNNDKAIKHGIILNSTRQINVDAQRLLS